ncbi:hypothetical protein Afil01_27800 [Actinorhabdospora filicis]|uniref:HEAT repeat domain-containing protein n=1 Tax=Actinorhabdospora filicis TaxID=1785913 RepID=A0A9W6SKL8_9ACTN|nr:HEAT repeat domain-containing protein [Actinorhabdospora filicis]GLZ77973.1 hypothetical protein Afil01_27800 [Actinorhabdospora filicis]
MNGEFRRLSRREIHDVLYHDPQARADPRTARAEALYAEAAAGMLAELAEAGFPVGSAGELYRERMAYAPAVPILIAWLPRAGYLPLAEDIVRALMVRFARIPATPPLLAWFRDPPPVSDPTRPPDSPSAPREHLRWVIGLALGGHATPAIADELIALALEREYGVARTEIVASLPKTKDPRVPDVLLGLLDDPAVGAYAVRALARLRHEAAKPVIEALVDSPDVNLRAAARKALKRLGD